MPARFAFSTKRTATPARANSGGYYLLSCQGGTEHESLMSYRFSPVWGKSGRLGLR